VTAADTINEEARRVLQEILLKIIKAKMIKDLEVNHD
jgi:hypothetical protein